MLRRRNGQSLWLEAGGRVVFPSDVSSGIVLERDVVLPDQKEFVLLLERPAFPSLGQSQIPLRMRVSSATRASSSLQALSTQPSVSQLPRWGTVALGEEKQPLPFTML